MARRRPFVIAFKGFLLLVVVFAAMEARLRFFSPSPFIAKGAKIVLPANKEYLFINKTAKRADPVVRVRKNALGFRGEEPPAHWDDVYSILILGGSSAASDNLTEGKTWADLLARKLKGDFPNVWLNNAGFAGHSTVANLLLMQDYVVKLKPKMVVFLSTINDIHLESQSSFDESIVKGKFQFNSAIDFLRSVSRNIETVNLLVNLTLKQLGVRRALSYGEMDVTQIPQLKLSDDAIRSALKTQRDTGVKGFDERLHALLDLCRKNGIQPVFVTVPALFQAKIDPETGVDLGSLKIFEGENGRLMAALLDLYNDRIRDLQKEGVAVIDLARRMPISSKYFGDFYHFTNQGAEEVATILYPELKSIIEHSRSNPV